MNEATLIRKGLFRKVLRAILMMVSISIAFLIFGVLGALNNALNVGVDMAAADRLITMNRINFTVSMPYAYYGRVQQVDGVANVSHANWFGGYFQDPTNQIQTFAVEPETWLRAYPELVVPDEQREAFFSTRDCLLVGQAVAVQQGWSVGDRIPLSSNIWEQSDGSTAWDLEICGIFRGESSSVQTAYALMHYDYFNESLAFARDVIGWMAVNTDDPSLNDDVAQRIDALFENSPAETETTTEAAFNQSMLEQIGDIGLILTLVIGASFATILMIVGTTLILSINERTKEIAVLKTLGFESGRIFRMILTESLLLSLIGGSIGLVIASAFVWLASLAVGGFLPGLGMRPGLIMQAIGLMILFALVTGLFPAYSAMRTRIVDAFGKI